MSTDAVTDDELCAYLDEALSVERMASIERMLRDSVRLRSRAAALAGTRDAGAHSVGEIWRRRRLSCPVRSQLGSYLLGTLDSGSADYVEFHLRTVGCRYCAANLRDLQEAAASSTGREQRRRKFFESSAGYLHQFRDEG